MKFNKYCFSLLVSVVVLIPAITAENDKVNLLKTVIPNLDELIGSFAKAEPIGPNIVGSLGLLHVAAAILADVNAINSTEVSSVLTKVDLDNITKIDNHAMESAAKVILELTYFIEPHKNLKNLNSKLESFRKSYADNMQLILNPEITGFEKNAIIATLLKYSSPFRNDLRSFVDTYIKRSTISPLSGPVKLLFDFILDKDRSLAMENDNCYPDSMVSKVFKTYLYILKTLTDSYAMVISAHVIQFQQEIQAGQLSDAASTKTSSKELIIEYKNNMKELFEKAKWALDNASRDIRNCGLFTNLEQGVDYERLSFANIIPRPMFMFKDEDRDNQKCMEDKDAVNLLNYQVDNCDVKTGIPEGSHLSIFYNSSRPDGPYQYMKVELAKTKEESGTGAIEIFGHKNSLVRQSKTDGRCKTVFCNVFKKKGVAFSAERVSAQPGNVITGIRFRVRKNVVYIDIQQGKYLNPISVDPKTVFWSETPESKKVVYLDSFARKIELGNFELEDGFLQAIQFYRSINDKILNNVIHPIIDGSSDPLNEYGPYFNGPYQPISNLNEVTIKEADDPVILGANVKNYISKPPVPDQPHFISFQPSDFKKDFGRSTVPFIDTTEVVSNPPAPLGGFGIYHQAGSGSGGFLSLKLLSPKLSYLVDYKQIEKFTNASKKVELLV